MRRVAEIIHVVESEREAFLDGCINPDNDTLKVLWLCGVRKQQYFVMNELILMTFEYEGDDFKNDMSRMSFYLLGKGHLVEKRRKDVPISERATTNWWAPLKKIGTLLDEKPDFEQESDNYEYSAMLEGTTTEPGTTSNISYDEDDWSESIHI